MANKNQRRRKQRKRRQSQERARLTNRGSGKSPGWVGMKPWEPVKMRMFEVSPDFFEGSTKEKRLEVIRRVASDAEETFQREFFRLNDWFQHYDALHLLAFCSFYFLTRPEGVDPEIKGHLDFYGHYLEILQAFSLMQDRSFASKPLGQEAGALLDLMGSIGHAMQWRGMGDLIDFTEEQIQQRFVLQGIRTQTSGVRNWGYLGHMCEVGQSLGDTVRSEFIDLHGTDPVKVMEALFNLAKASEGRVNEHLGKVRSFYQRRSVQEVAASYVDAFPDVADFDADQLFQMAGRKLASLKAVLALHSDLLLSDIFTFTLDDIAAAYGEGANREYLGRLFDELSMSFGELRDQNKEYIILDNPVWKKPFIKIASETYFSAVIGIMPHYFLGIFEALVSKDSELEEKYRSRKARYLEEKLETLFVESFPSGKIHRGSMWDDGAGGNGENNLTAIVGSVALVVEAKSGLISPPAGRGAPDRFQRTVQELIEDPAEQANRFISVLKSLQEPHAFPTKGGPKNTIDVSQVRHYIPITITLEQFGSVSNLRSLVESGITTKTLSELAPVISLTDMMVIFEILELQSEKLHFLARRREIDANLNWHGDELDVLGFYLAHGLNIGEAEFSGEHVYELLMYSKSFDLYYEGLVSGVSVPKPELALTQRWKDMLTRLEQGPVENWLDASILLLNVPFQDQIKLERKLDILSRQVRRGKTKQPHNAVILLAGPPQRRFFLAFYAYTRTDRKTRNEEIQGFLDLPEAKDSRGAICVAVDIDETRFPYSVLACRPSPDLFDEIQ